LMGPRVLALGVVKVNTLVGTNLASRLGEGSVSALNLGWIVMQIPETIIATAIATAVFPTLSQYAAQGDRERLRATITSALRSILLLSVPALLGLLLLARPIVQILFQGGRFGADSTNLVVMAVQFYALGLLGHSFLEVAARSFYARKDTVTPFAVALLAMLVNGALAVMLIAPFAHGGIALANAVAVSLEAGLLLWIATRRGQGVQPRVLLALATRVLAAGAAMLGLLFVAERVSASPFVVLGMGALSGLIYFGLLWMLGAEELRGGLNALLARVRRGAAPPVGESVPEV
ncbi:MAG: oligosaccharide flippase family protein, partial [Chloroflexi bacterium]|nr:oligosaccharide flippase family protein [Chloroflexota bacterium]